MLVAGDTDDKKAARAFVVIVQIINNYLPTVTIISLPHNKPNTTINLYWKNLGEENEPSFRGENSL